MTKLHPSLFLPLTFACIILACNVVALTLPNQSTHLSDAFKQSTTLHNSHARSELIKSPISLSFIQHCQQRRLQKPVCLFAMPRNNPPIKLEEEPESFKQVGQGDYDNGQNLAATTATTSVLPVSTSFGYPLPRQFNESLLGDLSGGRPGAIIESVEQLLIKEQMLKEIDDGVTRKYDADLLNKYGELQEVVEADYDIDDPEALDMATLGTWTIQDLNSKFDYEWDPNSGEADPNLLEMQQEKTRYLAENPIDDDNVEIGYDPIFGPSNPMDTRTVLGSKDSYMIDDSTRDDSMLTPQFLEDDPEIQFNQDIVKFRKSLEIIETFTDPFLSEDLEIPRHVAKWHGYPERTHFAPKPFENNRFTKPQDLTDFDSLSPFRARQRAVELARAKNAEWLPKGVSQAWHEHQRKPYEDYKTLVGTLRKGESDPVLVEQIQPVLKVLGSCVELLSIDESVYRFAYHGLIKNKFGMECWTKTMLEDCGVEVTGVVFETGFRKRDALVDGGDPWYAPSF